MINKLGNVIALLLGWPRLGLLSKGLFYLGARGLGFLNYSSDRVSGEKFAIDKLIRSDGQPVVFDVGANEGAWTGRVLARNREAVIHAFEPQSTLAESLATQYPRALVNNVAVGEQLGECELFDYEDSVGSQHASLVPGVIEDIHGSASRKCIVPVVTLDDYCGKNAIGNIDFLKIDVEGYELRVLRGATDMIRTGRVRVIQFEFNEMNVKERVFFKDFYDLLSNSYFLYRLLPNGLSEIEKYSAWLCEQFVYQNIVAIKRS